MMRRLVLVPVVVLLALPAAAAAHIFDHQAPSLNPPTAPPLVAQSGGAGAKWEFLATIPTGNPHTDLDFFTQRGNVFASVGTLAAGTNGGGQTIVQLTQGGKVTPKFVASAPTASCLSNPDAALGLQHDAEAAPKGGAILNTDVLAADRRDTQLILDATDAEGRCHDQGIAGLAQAPQGGLEIIDVTNPGNPQTIGLTTHIGEAHTVNVDPKRPHIAYAVTSDSVGVNAQGKRSNEDPAGAPNNLDGFEVVNLASCMNFAPGTSLEVKRQRCRPEVYRYRYPSTVMSLGHTNKTGIYGCHELEVYPDDRLTCASGAAMIMFDMKGAFDDHGTPSKYWDDRPRGTRLPCRVRPSSSLGPFATGASVTDCVASASDAEALSVPKWLASGAPSLQGVRWLGSAFHPGRESTTGAASPKFDSTKDIDFDHEAEMTASGRYVLATDERGGGVLPPGASCSPSTDLKQGNGGIHAYDVKKLLTRRPKSADDAHSSYARAPGGGQAIYRATIRTQPQDSLCTAHVFQQIPGQNRIFMGWYSQGTQVVDFEERSDGTLRFKDAGYFIPQQADEWVSHVFKVQQNLDGTFTYWGATGDFYVGNAGRNAIDIWKVTLPPAPAPRGRLAGTGRGFASRCLSRKVRVGRKGIGRVRFGLTKRAVRRRAGLPVRSSKRVYRWCVKRDKKGRVSAVFDRRGRVRLVGSTARRHTARRIARGSRLRSVRRLGARRIGRRLYRRGRVIFGARKNRVTFVAVADKRVLRKRQTLRGFLKLGKLR